MKKLNNKRSHRTSTNTEIKKLIRM